MLHRTMLSTSAFKASTEEKFSRSERERLLDRIESEPSDGEEVRGLEGLRLLLWPSRSSGELAWHQAAYLYIERYELVYLLDVLDCQEEAVPTHQDKLDAIEKLGRISELGARIMEIIIRAFGS